MDNIFALDSSGKTAGVCVLQNGIVSYEKTLDEGLTHSETLLPLAQAAMAETGLCPASVGLWAVTTGPGSFTGLRIGVSLVKGMAFAGTAGVVGVSTLKAAATASGLCGTVLAALNARRGQVYWAAFSCGENVRRLTADVVQNVDDMYNFINESKENVFFVGDGAEMCYNSFMCMPKVKRQGSGTFLPIAKGAAILAAKNGKPMLPSGLQPQYLRLSQAERQRLHL